MDEGLDQWNFTNRKWSYPHKIGPFRRDMINHGIFLDLERSTSIRDRLKRRGTCDQSHSPPASRQTNFSTYLDPRAFPGEGLGMRLEMTLKSHFMFFTACYYSIYILHIASSTWLHLIYVTPNFWCIKHDENLTIIKQHLGWTMKPWFLPVKNTFF